MEHLLQFGTGTCHTFTDSPSGHDVLFNDDMKCFVVFHQPTKEDLRELLLDYTQRRINELWKMMDREVVRGEKTGLAAFTKAEGNRAVLLRAEALMQRFPGLYQHKGKGKLSDGIHGFISSLPLDRQREMLKQIRPPRYEELHSLFTATRLKAQFAYEPVTLLDEYTDFTSFLLMLLDKIRNREKTGAKGNADANIAARHQDILFLMAARKWLLLPVRYGSFSTSPGVSGQYDRFIQCGCYLSAESDEFMAAAYKMISIARRNAEIALRTVRMFFFSSTTRAVNEISVSSVAFFEKIIATKIPLNAGFSSGSYTAGDALRTIFENKFPDRLFPAYRATQDGADLNRKSPTFKRVAVEFPDQPVLHDWGKLFAKYVVVRQQRTMTHIVYYMWRFLEYLATLEQIPISPAHIVRHIHIRDASGHNRQTYFDYLQQDAGTPKPKNAAIHELRRFFDWYLDYQVAVAEPVKLDANPVKSTDVFGLPTPNLGMSHRLALPEFVLEAIKETIVADDFAFPRSRPLDYFETLDADGRPARVWFPGTAVCMYFLLDQPVRLKQARWLDDGAYDDETLDVTCTIAGDLTHYRHQPIRNPSPQRIKGRKQGVIRAIHDFGKLDSFLGLFINTNKTDDYDGVTPNGYEIPYASPKMLDLLLIMRDWQQKWMLPLDELVPYLDGEDLNETLRDKVPQVSPLFRDPLGPTRRRPVSDHRLRRFYTDVLEETEQRLRAKGYTTQNGFDVQLIRPIEQPSGRTYNSPIYDVHSLRVSGITALLMRGVPIEVVSRYVANHKTLTMTLWYLKPTPGQCRNVLMDAYALRREEYSAINGDFAKSPELQSNWEAYRKHFLSNVRPSGESDALHALEEGRGIWRIQPDGICPGTECSTGFLYEQDKSKGYYGAVPGGKTCSLCRYWITGPMFLLGQVIKMNSVMLTVEKKATELRALKDDSREMESTQQWKDLHATRSRIHELEEELEVHVNDWHARLRFITASMQQMDSYLDERRAAGDCGSDLPIPWISANTQEGMNLILEETHSFVLLDTVAQGMQFIPGLNHQEAKLDHQRILNSILRRGGAKHLLLDLPDDIAFEAGNLLSTRLIQAASANGVDIGKLVSGEIELKELTVRRNGRAMSLLDDLDSVLEVVARAKSLNVARPLLASKQNNEVEE